MNKPEPAPCFMRRDNQLPTSRVPETSCVKSVSGFVNDANACFFHWAPVPNVVNRVGAVPEYLHLVLLKV
jgi:hypothetical protein